VQALSLAGASRAELVALEVADLVELADGLRVVIRHGKTDQEGRGLRSPFPAATASGLLRRCRRGSPSNPACCPLHQRHRHHAAADSARDDPDD
jgi:hypothetical protein